MQYLRRLIVVAILAIAASGPALGLSPSAFQVLFSGGWWLPGASVDMNFAQAKYYGCDISCVSVTRASTKTNLLPSSASGFSYVTFASNVPAIDSNGFLIEEARTNQLFNSTAPATQTTGSLGTGTYTLWVNGSGSAQMSTGTGTGCGTGTATNGSVVNFTITVAGTCTVTKTGSLNAFQLELGAFGTSLIVTAGASATRAADNVTATGALLATLQGSNVSAFAQITQPIATNASPAARSYFLSFFDAGGTSRFAWRSADVGGTTNPTFVIGNGVANNSISVGNVAANTLIKSAISWSLTSANQALATNGTSTTAANQFVGGINQMLLGVNNSITYQRLAVFNSILPSATLKAITAP